MLLCTRNHSLGSTGKMAVISPASFDTMGFDLNMGRLLIDFFHAHHLRRPSSLVVAAGEGFNLHPAKIFEGRTAGWTPSRWPADTLPTFVSHSFSRSIRFPLKSVWCGGCPPMRRAACKTAQILPAPPYKLKNLTTPLLPPQRLQQPWRLPH
jgi:hypothetical protein